MKPRSAGDFYVRPHNPLGGPMRESLVGKNGRGFGRAGAIMEQMCSRAVSSAVNIRQDGYQT